MFSSVFYYKNKFIYFDAFSLSTKHFLNFFIFVFSILITNQTRPKIKKHTEYPTSTKLSIEERLAIFNCQAIPTAYSSSIQAKHSFNLGRI